MVLQQCRKLDSEDSYRKFNNDFIMNMFVCLFMFSACGLGYVMFNEVLLCSFLNLQILATTG